MAQSEFLNTSGEFHPAAPSIVINVWPAGKMPGMRATEAEREMPSKGDGIHRITNVSQPTLAVFPAKRGSSLAPAAVVCPGGGYRYVVVDKEGSDIAVWLNSLGVTAIVLKYRVPGNRGGALADIQRTLSLIRSKASEWNADPKRLGVIGFSAGGNLSAKASTRFGERVYPKIDKVDQESCRPDFAVLVYPAYLEDKDGGLSSELNLRADIPPTFLVHSEDDKAHVPGTKLYHAALKAVGVSSDFKLYPTGGHGYGLRCQGHAKVWSLDARKWFLAQQIL